MRLAVLGPILVVLGCRAATPPAVSSGQLDEPDITITSPDSGGIAFDLIAGVYLPSDSQLIIRQPRSRQFLLFRRTGQVIRVIGRPGQGPGEFQRISQAGLRGDSLWGYDPIARRVSWFSASGSFLGTQSFQARLAGWPHEPEPLAFLANGSVLAQGAHTVSGLANRSTPSRVPLLRLDHQGQILQRLSVIDLTGWAFDATGPSGGIVGIQPFTAVPITTVASDGTRWALLQPNSPDPSHTTITIWGSTGDTLVHAVYPFAGERLTTALADSLLELLGPGLTQVRAKLVYPSHLSGIAAAIFGPRHSLWIRRGARQLRSPRMQWIVLDSLGRVCDTISRTAADWSALDESGVWSVDQDTLGVPLLRHYPLPQRLRC